MLGKYRLKDSYCAYPVNKSQSKSILLCHLKSLKSRGSRDLQYSDMFVPDVFCRGCRAVGGSISVNQTEWHSSI